MCMYIIYIYIYVYVRVCMCVYQDVLLAVAAHMIMSLIIVFLVSILNITLGTWQDNYVLLRQANIVHHIGGLVQTFLLSS